MTSAFLSPLIADCDDLPYVLIDPLIYRSARLGTTIEVPPGFHTDLASIPQLLQNLLPKEGKYNAPAVVHDYLYATGWVNGVAISRSAADAVLKEAMAVRLVDPDRAEVIYLGVRIGGWVPWRKYRRG